MPSVETLRQLQSLPLEAKVVLTQQRIREWYDHFNGDVCICFSGGKDSTVLAHLVHEMYPSVPMIFSNTGLEYPEIQAFAKKMGAEFVRPKMSFPDVIAKYGYPILSKEIAEAIYYARKIGGGGYSSKETQGNQRTKETSYRRKELIGVANTKQDFKSMFNKEKWLPMCQQTEFGISHYCCSVIKKSPLKIYQRKNHCYPYLGTQASESRLRQQAWIRHGCNAFESNAHTSQPMSFWNEQDVLQYIVKNGLEIASVYGDIVAEDDDGLQYAPIDGVSCNLKCTGCQRTGCIFCGFGFHLDKGKTRFQRLAETHPKQYEYCMKGGQYVDNPCFDATAPKYDGDWENWNPKKIWIPSKEGLGMKKVFDDCNAIYGKDFMRYE